MEMLQAKWDKGKFVCVGLDSDMNHAKFPSEVPLHPFVNDMEGAGKKLNDEQKKQLSFNYHIIDLTHNLVCAYKPNLAFYRGARGKRVLQLTIDYINIVAYDVPVILDAKQGDIGNTNSGYVDDDFLYYEANAVTVNPYLGMVANKPFLGRADQGIILLCRTSNEGAGEFQDLPVPSPDGNGVVPLYQLVAHNIARHWNYNSNCAVVVGATYPQELAAVRQIIGDMPILLPGIGAQGGDLEATVAAGKNSRGQGMIINSSRGIIFASSGEDFAEAARAETLKLHDAITRCLQAA